MKKYLFIIFLTIILISHLSALEIKTDKDSFKKGETFFATLSGNILEDIKIENVGFYRGHVQVPFTFDLIKLNGVYYLYALLPYTEQNYSLKIKDVYYKENNLVQTSDLEKFFSISSETAEFNVNPGFVLTAKDFKISAYNNLNSDLELTLTLENNSFISTIPLQDSKQISIPINNILSTNLTFLEINSASDFGYKIPVYVFVPSGSATNQLETEINDTDIEEIGTEKLRFMFHNITDTLNKGEKRIHTLTLSNLGQENAKNIKISTSSDLIDYISFSTKQISEIDIGESVEINLTATFNKIGNFSGFVLAESENSSDLIYFYFNVGENVSSTSSLVNPKTCSEIGGKKCDVCGGYIVTASDGECCIGSCSSSTLPKEKNWIVLAVILALLSIIIVFIILKLRKPKPTSRDILNKREKSYRDRFETRGMLSKD